MNKTFIFGLFGAVFCGGIYLAYHSAGANLPEGGEKSTNGAAIKKSRPESTTAEVHSESASTLSVNTPPVTSQGPIPDSAEKQRIIDAIQLASVSYDPAELPRIQPYLTHPDPELRQAALDGMIVLGHAAGAPLLREAARRTANPSEAAELLNKADYLELPSAPIELLRQKFKSQPSKNKPLNGNKSP